MPGDDPHVPTVSASGRRPNWLEREVWDLFGIAFDGHPDPRRLLMPEDWEGYPLRKDYPVQIKMPVKTYEPLQVTAEEFARQHRRRREIGRGAIDVDGDATRDARCRAGATVFDDAIALHERMREASSAPVVDGGGGDCGRRSARAASCWCSATAAAPRTRSTSRPSWSGGSSASARRLAAIALTTDTSVADERRRTTTAFERVFARQVEALGRPGDVALGITTSGASAERAARRSRRRGARADRRSR